MGRKRPALPADVVKPLADLLLVFLDVLLLRRSPLEGGQLLVELLDRVLAALKEHVAVFVQEIVFRERRLLEGGHLVRLNA